MQHCLVLLGVQRGLERVGSPQRVHQALAVDHFLVEVDFFITGVGRACVAFLMPAQPAHTGAPASDVLGRKYQAHQCALDHVVVVAPDDAFLIRVESARTMS